MTMERHVLSYVSFYCETFILHERLIARIQSNLLFLYIRSMEYEKKEEKEKAESRLIDA